MINLERRKQILDLLSVEGSIKTTELSERLGVTGATIRTDLRDLAREGAIVRYHGGIKLPQEKHSEFTENYMVRSVTHVDLKSQIGKEAASFVGSGSTIFMDASSTTFHMIQFLKDTENVTVSKSRTVIVIGSDITYTLTPNEFTSDKVTINLLVDNNYMEYVLLPDEKKIRKKHLLILLVRMENISLLFIVRVDLKKKK